MKQASLLAALLAILLVPAGAGAAFGPKPGTEGFDVTVLKANGTPENRAGIHPHRMNVKLSLNSSGGFSEGDLRDLKLELPPGLLVNLTPVDECATQVFRTPRVSPHGPTLSGESCPDGSQVGVLAVSSSFGGGSTYHFGVFALQAPYGAPLAFGAAPFGVPIVFSSAVREADAGIDLELRGLSQAVDFQAFELTLWGTPWDHSHDDQRGNCLREDTGGSFGTCVVPVEPPEALPDFTKSILTLPTSCAGPPQWNALARSWEGEEATTSVQGHNALGQPLPIEQCKNGLTQAHVRLSTDEAGSGSGLAFELEVDDGGGILNPGGIARPAIREADVALPAGLTINPALGAGLGTCSKADFAREAVNSPPGFGCPNSSKVGTVRVEGMIGLPEDLTGSLFLAEPHSNPLSARLALYLVASQPRRGLFVRSIGRLEPDPASGRLAASFRDLPSLLYTRFTTRLREGQRAALVSPPACGSYPMQMQLRAWGRPNVLLEDTGSLAIARGQAGGQCPSGAPPFTPTARAGSLNPQAGAYSPFVLYLGRDDGDQEITSYSATLPPGVLGKIVGIPFCSDVALAAAAAKTGLEELRDPSCPAASSIGRTETGYGVGGVLAYAPGGLYLAGPYKGSAFSVVAVNSAVVGPFDLGTILVRSAIDVDPRTAQVTIDSSASDPIPHILDGVPLHLRDIRVYVDRPGLTLNPTSCSRFSIVSTLTGSAAPFTDPRGAVGRPTVPYQAFNCGSLGFQPSFSLALSGGSKRGAHPQLKATFVPRSGDANVKAAAVTLPRSIFLDQRNIRDICTRAQAEANACSTGSIVGHAKAETPLLDEPLEGPVYLRSSSNPLPDLVAVLSGRGVRIVLEGRVDSHRKGIRASFDELPDAPVNRFTMTMFGGRERGLLVSAEQLCRKPQVGEAKFLGQANLGRTLRPRLGIKCPKRKGGKGAKRGGKKRGGRL